MNPEQAYQDEIAKHKTFLADWLDSRLEKTNLGPACVAMLETVIERAAGTMGNTYARHLLHDTFKRLRGNR